MAVQSFMTSEDIFGNSSTNPPIYTTSQLNKSTPVGSLNPVSAVPPITDITVKDTSGNGIPLITDITVKDTTPTLPATPDSSVPSPFTINNTNVSVNGQTQSPEAAAALLSGYAVPTPSILDNPVTPNPVPAPVTPVAESDFQISPFLEKVLINPYSPQPLNILNQAQLAIDDVVNYIEGFLPSELIPEIKNLPFVANMLLSKGQSLEQFVSSLATQIPAALSLPGLLRICGVQGVANNIGSLMSTVSSLGLMINNLPATFTADALNFMNGMNADLNTSTYAANFTSILHLNTLTGYTGKITGNSVLPYTGGSSSSNSNPGISAVANTAITLAKVNLTAGSQVPVINAMSNLGTTKPATVVPLSKVVNSAQFPVITKTVQAMGGPTATGIIAYKKAVGSPALVAVTNTIATVNAPAVFTKVATTVSAVGQTNAALLVKATATNPVAVNNVAINIKDNNTTAIKPITAILSVHDLPATSALITAIVALPPVTVNAVVSSIKNNGLPNTTTIVTAIHGFPDTAINSINSKPPAILAINNSLKTSGILITTNIVNAILALPINDVVAALTNIKAIGSVAYIAANGIGPYSSLLNLVATYGIDTVLAIAASIDTVGVNNFPTVFGSLTPLITTYGVNTVSDIANAVIASGKTNIMSDFTTISGLTTTYTVDTVNGVNNSISTIGSNNINAVVNDVATLGIAITNDLIHIADNTSPNILLDSISNLTTDDTAALNTAIEQTAIVGSSGVLTILTAINTITAPKLVKFIDTITLVNPTLLTDSIPSLLSLSSADTRIITGIIGTTEPTTTIIAGNLHGIFLSYAVKKACELCALAGNYRMVINLLSQYTGEITVSYRKFLIATILENYKEDADDIVMGPELAAIFLAESLNVIYYAWFLDVRNAVSIDLHTSYLKASKSALKLLCHYPATAVAAILQLDNNYSS